MFTELPRVVAHASRGKVFSYSSYFMLKGQSMAIGFNPNRRAGSKEVWTVLLTIERPVSWSVLAPGTVTPQIPKVNFFFFFFLVTRQVCRYRVPLTPVVRTITLAIHTITRVERRSCALSRAHCTVSRAQHRRSFAHSRGYPGLSCALA